MAWNLSTAITKGLLGPDAPKGSLTDLLITGVIEIYSGARPANSDAVETGTLLLTITLDGLAATTPMTVTNGINLGAFVALVLKQATGETWKGTGVADGTAGWARWYAAPFTKGASTTAVRMDGTVSVSGADVNMANGTTVTIGVDSEVTDVSFNMSGV